MSQAADGEIETPWVLSDAKDKRGQSRKALSEAMNNVMTTRRPRPARGLAFAADNGEAA
jgi:hypothetical protein